MFFSQTQKTFLLAAWAVFVCGSQSRAEAVLSVSVNGLDVAEAVVGAPVIISATLTDTAEIADRDWKMQITNARGETIDAPVTLRRKGDPMEVSGIYSQSVTWTIHPDATAKLPTGDYLISAGEGKPATLRILNAAPSQSDTDKIESLLLLSEFAELDGRLDDALQSANDALALNSGSVGAYLRKCDVLIAKGELAKATDVLDDAASLAQKTSTKHIPITITARQREIQMKLDAPQAQ